MRWSFAIFAALLLACTPDPARPAPSEGAKPTPAPTIVDQAVTWPAARPSEVTLAALPDEARAAVAASRVPVLVVARPGLLPVTKVMAKPKWTAISASAEGLTVSLSATRSAHRHPHLGPAEGKDEVRGEPAFITQNEGIWSATWIEHGVSYVLEVECASRPDPRCDDDAQLRSLIDELAYVGGEGAR